MPVISSPCNYTWVIIIAFALHDLIRVRTARIGCALILGKRLHDYDYECSAQVSSGVILVIVNHYCKLLLAPQASLVFSFLSIFS